MEVTVRLFGPGASLAGQREVSFEIDDGATCASVREQLCREVPKLAPFATEARLAVNHEFVDETTVIGSEDELALIGMVSGG